MTDRKLKPSFFKKLQRRRPIEEILQAETAECGLACLAMINRFYGSRETLSDLRREFPVSPKGSHLRDIQRYGKRLGFNTRALRVGLNKLDAVQLPCILHWDICHFVVLQEVRNDHVVIVDPAIGRSWIGMEDLSRHFTGIVLEFRKTDTDSKETTTDSLDSAPSLFRFIDNKVDIVKFLVLSLVIQALVFMSPMFLQMLIDSNLSGHDESSIFVFILAIFASGVLLALTEWVRTLFISAFGGQYSLAVSEALFSHVLKMPASFFVNRHSADLISRFKNVHEMRRLLLEDILPAAIDVVFASVAVVLLTFLYWPIGLIAIGAIIILVTHKLKTANTVKQRVSRLITTEAKEEMVFLETLRGMTTVKLYGREEERFERWQAAASKALTSNFEFRKTAAGHRYLEQTAEVIEIGLLLTLCAIALSRGSMTTGAFVAVFAYYQMARMRISNSLEKLQDVQSLQVYWNRIQELFKEAPETLEAVGESPERTPELSDIVGPVLELKGVSYSYSEASELILENVDLSIENGECLVFVGPTGAGKSTLVRLMAGLVRPKTGQVFYGGVGIEQSMIGLLRKRIAVFMQDDILFSGTVMENITLFDHEPDRDFAVSCARRACIHEEIEEMPMSYNSLVGENGAALSGGQKQRILLARALYKDPELLILDEPTSNVDVVTENAISAAIRELPMAKIIISHRPATALFADRTLLVSNGQITELTGDEVNSFFENNLGGERRDANVANIRA